MNINHGEFNRNVNVLNIQPVIPFANGKIITRTIFPIVNIPDFSSESGKQTSGLSDIIATAFFVPESEKLMWGFGPVIELPTGGEMRGSQKWSVVPSFLALVQPGDWTADSENKWIVPLGAGFGKLSFLGGKLPLNLQTQMYYNVVRPNFGPEWQWRLQAQILLPANIFKGGK